MKHVDIFSMDRSKDKASVFKQISNPMALPKLSKIVINAGLGKAKTETLDKCASNLAMVLGQKPIITLVRRANAGFSIRTGQKIGLKATLRQKRMYNFIDKLVHIVIPSIQDFRGLKKQAFDSRGNYNFGIADHVVFPEILYDQAGMMGLDINIVTTAENDQDGFLLLQYLGMPFIK